jgi:hypothetical protein
VESVNIFILCVAALVFADFFRRPCEGNFILSEIVLNIRRPPMSASEKEKVEKHNCYVCKHRQDVIGSTHSSCHHPKLGDMPDNPILGMMAILGGVRRVPTIQAGIRELGIQADPHGVRRGWFIFPYNFDPVWLRACNGFEPKESMPKEAVDDR